MWHNTRRGHNLIRKRYSTRKFRLNAVNICIIVACVFVVGFASLGIKVFKHMQYGNMCCGK